MVEVLCGGCGAPLLCAPAVTRHTKDEVRRHRNKYLELGFQFAWALARVARRDPARARVTPPVSCSHDQDAWRGLAVVFDGLAAVALRNV